MISIILICYTFLSSKNRKPVAWPVSAEACNSKIMLRLQDTIVKILQILISMIAAGALLSSCDTNKDTDGGVSTITYTTNNAAAPGNISFPITGITLDATKTAATWSCPAGYVIPTALAANPPSAATNTTITCEVDPECSYKTAGVEYKTKWEINTDEEGNDMKKGESSTFFNNDNFFMDVRCVPSSEKDGWS